jgi:hypothetical protein
MQLNLLAKKMSSPSEWYDREIVSKISLSGGQGFVHCQCKKGYCKSGRCKCQGWKLCATLGIICLCHVATSKHSWFLEW